MAIYNGRRFLQEQIDSLLGQTKLPDRIVCCDDESSDGSLEWIREYARSLGQEERFLLVKNEQNLGYIRNFYHALDLCDADLLFLCDQDDIWAADKMERMEAEFAKNSNLMLLSCAHTLISAQGEPISSMRYGQKNGCGALLPVSEKEIVTLFRWPGMTMALRRSFWSEVRETARQIAAPHDRVLALLAASRGQMAYLDVPLCCHRLHASNSGGEENSMKMYLARDFKRKELFTSKKWLEAQIAHGQAFSPAATLALREYRDYVAYRLDALERRSIGPLLRALGCRGYVHLRGIAADLASILLNR